MGYLTLLVSLAIAAVAGWYSIAGLAAIFSGAVIPIIIMGAVLEIGKLVTASWLYRHWTIVPFLLKTYLTSAVVVLMLITSLGIFGFLSKAHLEQTISTGGNNELQVQMLERQIANERRNITDGETVLAQLDQAVQTLMDYDRIRGPEGALAVRQGQAEERAAINNAIQSSLKKIERLSEELLPLQQKQLEIELEVGPLKYVAELIYGDEANSHFDEAVRWVIILLIFVFDPLAVLLLIAANMTLKQQRQSIVRQSVIKQYENTVEKPIKQANNAPRENKSKKPKRPEDWIVRPPKGKLIVDENNISKL